MYIIQRFPIQPHTLACLFETIGSELQEERNTMDPKGHATPPIYKNKLLVAMCVTE